MDQAETLRKLMQERMGLANGKEMELGTPIVSFTSNESDNVHCRSFMIEFARGLAAQSIRTLVIDFVPADTDLFKLQDSFEPVDLLKQVEPDLWTLSISKKALFSSDELSSFEKYVWNFDVLLLSEDVPGAQKYPLIFVTSPNSSVEGVTHAFKNYEDRCRHRQIAVAVSQVTEPRRARDFFVEIESKAQAWTNRTYYYLGYLPPSHQSLIDWSEGEARSPHREWIVKRFQEWRNLEWRDSERGLDFSAGASRAPIVYRVQDEPIGSALPRRWNGFWRTLFSEVNYERS